MDTTTKVLFGALALVVLVMGVFFYVTTRGSGGDTLSADDGIALFADLCTINVIEKGITRHDVTREQVNSACKCLGRDFSAELTGLTAEETNALLNSAPDNKRMRSSAIKCFRHAGLDFAEE